MVGLMQSLIVYASKNDIPEIEMVFVEGGTFTMGFDADETEHAYETPKHEVTQVSDLVFHYHIKI